MFKLHTFICLVASALTLNLGAQEPAAPTPAKSPAPAFPPAPLEVLLDPEVVQKFASLPIQENGRIKPMETLARFRLLRFFGKQHIVATNVGSRTSGMGQPDPVILKDPLTGKPLVDEKGKARDFNAVQWMLISLFRPDIARDLPVFVVDNSESVQELELGLQGKGKRDHYSMNELIPGRQLLMQKMQEVRAIETKNQTPVQRAMAKLSIDFLEYEIILGHFDFMRTTFKNTADKLPPELAPLVTNGRPADWGTFLTTSAKYFKADPSQAAPMVNPWARELWTTMLGGFMSGSKEIMPRLFPPPVSHVEDWSSPGTIIESAMNGKEPSAEEISQLKSWGQLYASAGDPAAFKTALTTYSDDLAKLTASRNEATNIGIERNLHKYDYFTNALYCSIFGFLILAASWSNPAARWAGICRKITVLLLVAAAILGVIGMVLRCIIMGRPPVTNLYETIIFITTAGVILALLAEWMMKRGIALAIAAVVGVVGMYLQLRFMNFEGKDTMEPLQAVLITNFWLATHVPCINLGYAAGMVASFFSVGYILLRCVCLTRRGDDLSKDFTRLSYAFTCVGLFLSLIGTVLGGIWANYSWGRFWGWDPKENGALLIVLVNLIVLHARLGGFIREVGLHCANVIQGIVVAFSWFATNQLGIGLHAYGELDGAWKWLYRFWTFMLVILIAGIALGIKDRQSKKSADDGSAKGKLNLAKPQKA